MPHTKRSAEFLLKVRRLRDKVKAGTLDTEERAEVAHLLEFNTTDSSCMVKAAENEPVFVLRGKDLDADKCVDHWCELQVEKTLGISPRQLQPLTKIADALECAREMREFPDRKAAD